MASIKLGPMITDIAGSVGGATFQRNRFGMTMRAKPLPLYSETPAQYNIRRLIISLQYSWQALTDAERLQWNRFLDFSGQTIRRDRSIRLSGQTLYIKYQLCRLLYDQDLLTTIAYVPMPDFYTLVQIDKDIEDYIYLTFNGTVDRDTYYFVCKVSSPRPENRAFSAKGLRWMDPGWFETDTYDITAAYLAAFGALPSIGDFLHYSIYYWSTLAPVLTGMFTGKLEVVSTDI